MASPHLTTRPDHNPICRISPSHLLAVQTSSTALQSHLGLNNPTPYALPPPLPISKPPNPSLQPHAFLLPESESARTSATTSVRALTFTDTMAGMHNPEITREGLLKRVVVGEGGVRELRVETVMVRGKGEQGEKWVFVSVVWERKGGRGKGEGRSGARRGRRRGRKMCFALPERGVVRLEGREGEGGVQVEGAGSSLLNIDTTRTASFSALFSSGEVPVFEFADVDMDVDEDQEENEVEGGFDARGEDEVEGEDEVNEKGEVEGEGEGEGMDGVEAGIEGRESGEENGDREGEIEGEVEVDGEVYGGAMNEGDGDGEGEEEWRSVKRAMGRGGCLVRFYV